MIFRFVRTSKVNSWLQINYPSSIVGTAGDNWKKFLGDHGGTGGTFHDLEQSYLSGQGTIRQTIIDRWSAFTAAAGYVSNTVIGNLRDYFEGVVATHSESTWTIFFWTRPK